MSQTVPEKVRWTTSDLELLSNDEWKRYEIIDGELFVTRAPHFRHQSVIRNICTELQDWSEETGLGEAIPAPGLIFTEADNVIPDLIWISVNRLDRFMDAAGHLTGAPELIIEVLSPGATNERRDREAKLKLYSIQGVEEYWIVNRELQEVEVYRQQNRILKQVTIQSAQDEITSPLLPGFRCLVQRFFRQIGRA
ncbi:Uma2 family endonuclease [Phormidesmis priestleyi ULC007]|uniref:Uma2 family endonuclease n=1 Tax=Phormidesmis priestleyi ULC007 TaxID=1920490 RepID=A0A2T1DGL3_9CYAN|nr:Uma2 family endonuclease [Phormidesmis priestleyi]PSB19640.1 Uma2 family endonuclease [Phormidesmis priestleyi ULC007]PZO53524.1 MAG: Uma2 family endonuclease [Phormidesmis priestleyi]